MKRISERIKVQNRNNWSNIICFKTNCQLKSGNADKIVIHLKYPRSDLQQKVQLIDSTPEPTKQDSVSRGAYELFSYEFESLSEPIEIVTRFQVELSKKKSPVSRAPFPVILERENIDYYLQPTPLVQSDAPEIRELSENLTALSKLLINAILRVVRWMSTYIKYDIEYLGLRQSSLEILNSKCGTCEDINQLFNAICRAANIPARIALGFSKADSGWGRHVWSEIFDPQFGWFPVDILSTPIQIGQLDILHLKRMTSLDCNEPELRVEYEYPTDDPIPIVEIAHALYIDRAVVPVSVEINPTLKSENKL